MRQPRRDYRGVGSYISSAAKVRQQAYPGAWEVCVERKSGNKPILVHGRYVFSESQATSLSWCMGGMCLTKVRQQAYPGAWEVCV